MVHGAKTETLHNVGGKCSEMARCQWRPDRTSNAIPPCKAVGHLLYLLDKNMYYEYALRPRTLYGLRPLHSVGMYTRPECETRTERTREPVMCACNL